ncbi:MAG: rhomboid family intramembrane serine protease [Pelovirga sp.]
MVKHPPTDIEQCAWIAVPAELKEGLTHRPLSRRQLRSWQLVLQARQIPCRIEQDAAHKHLMVPAAVYQEALAELLRYEEENRNWPPPPPAESPVHPSSIATLWVLALLVIFHNVASHSLVLFGSADIDWLGRGSAHAGSILDGQWWRLVTALTLHSGITHLLGNIAIGGLLMLRLGRMFGAGLAFALVISSGIMGNALNAFLQSPDHRSIGSSTAIFGALGLLATYNMLRYRHSLWRRWPVPLAAALGLLAMLGSGGENTDIGAHLLGFLSGAGLACLAQKGPADLQVSAGINRLLGLLCLLLVAGAWWLAQRNAPAF